MVTVRNIYFLIIKDNHFTNLSPSFQVSSHLPFRLVKAFCVQWGINSQFKPEAPGLDKSIDQCPAPAGSVALYCRHYEYSKLRLARVFHIEILCRAAGYDPSLLSSRCFFQLAKNGDWFMFATSQVDTCLILSMVTTLGSWKDRFFWVSK
ncbi:hypothetical protein Hanom_Chr00s000005g01612481 [Helianthus anomalus]